MTTASDLTAEISAWLSDPGFTPGAKHLTKLFSALATAEREDARKLERALGRAGDAAGRFALGRLAEADARERSRLFAVLGRVANASSVAEFRSALLSGLEDSDERVRRVASSALGKLAVPEAAERLLEQWPRASVLERRSLAEALGKSGSEAALALLRSERPSDPELARILERARLMLERDIGRGAPSSLALGQVLGAPQSVIAHCRPGLSWVLAEEARVLGAATVVGPDRVRLSHRGTFGELLRVRTALGFGLEIPLPGSSQDSLASRVVGALEHPDAERAVRAWTNGRARFRLAFAEGGHQRDKVWRLAAAIAERISWLHNDTQESLWEVVIDTRRNTLQLCPRGFEDPRFSYRSQDVPAASHPTVAAALARVAGVHAEDIVWDPFVGSGLELIERGLLGPFRELHGSDLESDALTAAHTNAERAKLSLRLSQADARSHRVKHVSLIISNPPMGRRVTRNADLGAQLDAFLANAASALAPGGRLVWLSPFADRTAATARRLGLKVTRHDPVDLGGFTAELQRFDR
ncbi:MAG TPA: HEAT repeat domain-containing protein [Polyangiaceae bacterium]|nr:HEAT repeat domain-containing protein [Polyangiaceae bacterium]